MKSYCILIFVLLFSVNGFRLLAQSTTTEQVIHLDPMDFVCAMNKAEAYYLLDTRTGIERSLSAIPASFHLDYFSPLMAYKTKEMDRAIPVFVYCRSGHRAATVAEKLRNLGFQKIYNLEGGMTAWQKAGFPIE